MDEARTRLRLRVSPGARRSAVVGRHGAAWKVRVTAAPERGRANDEVIGLLARTFGLPSASVELVAGSGSRDKVVVLHGMSAPVAEARLAEVAEAS